MIRNAIAIMMLMLLCGCGDPAAVSSYESEVAALEASRGPAEEVTRADVSNYHSRTHWYYRQGFARTFSWNDGWPVASTDAEFTPIKRMIDYVPVFDGVSR